jgi:hypothetical protein
MSADDGSMKHLWNIYKFLTDYDIPEDSHIHTCHHENLKSHQVYTVLLSRRPTSATGEIMVFYPFELHCFKMYKGW